MPRMFRVAPWAIVATMAFAAAATAQQVGTSPPEFEIVKAWNDGPKSFADFEGKVVILDFAQTW